MNYMSHVGQQDEITYCIASISDKLQNSWSICMNMIYRPRPTYLRLCLSVNVTD